MRLTLLVLLTSALLTACGTAGTPAPTPLPTTPPLTGDVSIDLPPDGSIIYAETLIVSGTASDLPADTFTLRIVTATDEIISEPEITVADDGTWQAEIVHEYVGDPIEVTIIARPTDPEVVGDYDLASIALSSFENRPDGTFASINAPAPDSVVGGDQIQVRGTASGLFENTLIITLTDSDDTTLNEQIITVNNPNFIDDVPWSADLLTGGHTGPAAVTISTTDAQAGDRVMLDRVDIMISIAAG